MVIIIQILILFITTLSFWKLLMIQQVLLTEIEFIFGNYQLSRDGSSELSNLMTNYLFFKENKNVLYFRNAIWIYLYHILFIQYIFSTWPSWQIYSGLLLPLIYTILLFALVPVLLHIFITLDITKNYNLPSAGFLALFGKYHILSKNIHYTYTRTSQLSYIFWFLPSLLSNSIFHRS